MPPTRSPPLPFVYGNVERIMDVLLNYKPAGKVIESFHKDTQSRIKWIMGPVGSGKSSATIMDLFMRACMVQKPNRDGVRKTRIVIVRDVWGTLFETTFVTYRQWINPDFFGKTEGSRAAGYFKHIIKTQLQDGTWLDYECIFIQCKDEQETINKLRSLEITSALLAEGDRLPLIVLSEILQRIGRYPSKSDGGATAPVVVIDSNAPSKENYLYEMCFDNTPPDNMRVFVQPPGATEEYPYFHPDAENKDNLPEDYYAQQRITLLSMPDGAAKVKRQIENIAGYSDTSNRVYDNYMPELHLAKKAIAFNKQSPLYIGLDAGLNAAAVFVQSRNDGGLCVLGELFSIHEKLTVYEFADLLVGYIKQHFADINFTNIVAVADPSAGNMSALSQDKMSWIDTLMERTQIKIKEAETNATQQRISAVKHLFNSLSKGVPKILIDPSCVNLRKGFSREYCFRKHTTEPIKNDYSHLQDALQYIVMHLTGGTYAGQRKQRFVVKTYAPYDAFEAH